jgi:hypothetical protein
MQRRRIHFERRVHLTVPVRPEDMVPGHRPSGWSPGVVLRLPEPRRLEIAFMPSKSHDGLYGTELTTIIIDLTIAGEPTKYLAARCRQEGGQIVVSIESKNAVRKAVKLLGEKALPKSTVTITPSVMRHQLIADLKKTFGAGRRSPRRRDTAPSAHSPNTAIFSTAGSAKATSRSSAPGSRTRATSNARGSSRGIRRSVNRGKID